MNFISFIFSLLKNRRDTTCGVIRTIPVFESANPRIYPIPEVARLENAFSFPAAPDFLGNITSNQKVRGNKMGFLFTLTGGDVRYFDEERLINQCELGFAPQLNLHSFNDMPIDAKVLIFLLPQRPFHHLILTNSPSHQVPSIQICQTGRYSVLPVQF